MLDGTPFGGPARLTETPVKHRTPEFQGLSYNGVEIQPVEDGDSIGHDALCSAIMTHTAGVLSIAAAVNRARVRQVAKSSAHGRAEDPYRGVK